MAYSKKHFNRLGLLFGIVSVLIFSPWLIPGEAQTQQRVVSLDERAALIPVSGPNVEEYPYSAVAKIIATFPKCKPQAGSGAFVSSDAVFTAAHVVYIPECGGMATEVVIIRGYDKGNEPFGRTRSIRIKVPPQYMQTEDPNYDFAAIITKDKSDSMFGFGVPSGDLRDIMIIGYPVSVGQYDGETMMKSAGPASFTFVNQLSYPVNTFSGMSGGPILQKNGVDRRGVTHYRVIGVHTRGQADLAFPVNFGAGFLDAFIEGLPRNR